MQNCLWGPVKCNPEKGVAVSNRTSYSKGLPRISVCLLVLWGSTVRLLCSIFSQTEQQRNLMATGGTGILHVCHAQTNLGPEGPTFGRMDHTQFREKTKKESEKGRLFRLNEAYMGPRDPMMRYFLCG